MAIDATQVKVMQACNNFFAVRCERVTDAVVSGASIDAQFKGSYRTGQLLRIHGAYRNSYGDFGEGSVYKVATYLDGVLVLDRPLHTSAPYLFIVLLEPTGEFLALCDEISAYEERLSGREGLASESIDGYSWSAAQNGTGFASAFADKLRPYRCTDNPTPLYYAREAMPWQ